MTLSVHLGYTPDNVALAYLKQRLHDDIRLTYSDTPIPPDCDILVAGRPSDDDLTASDALRALLIPFAGLPAVTRERLQNYPHIAVHNLHHNAPPTAEMALALLLAAAKCLIPSDRDFRRHDWTPRYEPYPSLLLQGKTALILGYGSVGEHLGTMLHALGMTVLGTRRHRIDRDNGIYPPESLPELLPRANALIIALPATDETDDLISEQELRLLPLGALLVNIGRAAVVDQYALYDALNDGHLRAAGLDVWYHYPPDEAARTNTPPADLPFHTLDNVVMSPHRAGGGGNDEIEERRMSALADSLNAAAEGAGLPHRVDLNAGY